MIKTNGILGEIKHKREKHVEAWERLQYGMFIHWGLYSELGGEWNGEPVKKGYSEQIQMWANIPGEEYRKVATDFTADQFDPVEIVQLAKDAGMTYVLITTKHHDGFAMFDTKTTDYNIVKMTPYGKDPIKLLADECARQGLKFGVYFSLVDWNEGHAFDHSNNNSIAESMEPMIEGQLRELMTNYGPICEVWFDMSSPTLSQSEKFASLVHELQPEAAVNGRIWNNKSDFRTLADNQVPSSTLDGAWQTPASIYHATWGYRNWQKRDDFDGKVRDLVHGLASIRARGGNYLLNIGPRGDGSIVDFEADVLREIGAWLDRHPEAVLGASGTQFGGQSWGEVTVNGDHLYLHVTKWPEDNQLILPGLATEVRDVVEEGRAKSLDWKFNNNDLVITLPDAPLDKVLPVVKIELAGEFRMIPERTVTADDDVWTIKADNFYDGRSFADEGNYNSLVENIVRQTGYFSNESAEQVKIKLTGKVENNDTKYFVEIGTESKVVTGKDLIETEVGPFNIEPNQVIQLNITLAEPTHKYEALGLEIDEVTIK